MCSAEATASSNNCERPPSSQRTCLNSPLKSTQAQQALVLPQRVGRRRKKKRGTARRSCQPALMIYFICFAVLTLLQTQLPAFLSVSTSTPRTFPHPHRLFLSGTTVNRPLHEQVSTNGMRPRSSGPQYVSATRSNTTTHTCTL